MKLKSIPHTLQHLHATAAAIITTIIIATTTTACTNHLPGNLPPQCPHNPTTPLPPGVVPLTLHMPTQAPTFGTPQPEEPWTRSGSADAGADALGAGAVSIVTADGATTTRAVPGFTSDNEWKDGDEVMIQMMMACIDPISGNPISPSMYVIFTTARYSAPGTTAGGSSSGTSSTTGSWHLQVNERTHYVHADMDAQTIPPLTPTHLPLLYTGTALGISLPLDYQPTKMMCNFAIAYAPGLIWSLNPVEDGRNDPSTYFIPAPNPTIPLGTAPYWDITNKSSGTIEDDTGTLTLNAVTEDDGDPITPTTDYTRLRIYVGSDMAGKQVQLQSYRFNYAYGIPGSGGSGFTEKSTDHTYTVDHTGNAYFYGTTRYEVTTGNGNEPLNGTCLSGNENTNNDARLTITLQGHPTTDGDRTTLFQASPYSTIILGSSATGNNNSGKSLAINAAAVIKDKQLPSITIEEDQLGDDPTGTDPSKMSYNEYVAALVAAAKAGKTRWVIDAEKNTVDGWDADGDAPYNSSDDETILNGIKAAMNNDDEMKAMKIHINLPQFTGTIPNSAFHGCTTLVRISIPKATTFGDTTFYGCTALTSISLPNATTFEESTFDGCIALTSVSLMQTGAWVSLAYSLFKDFAPTNACTVQVAAGTYNTVGTNSSGKSTWAPTKEDDTTAIDDGYGTTTTAFTSGSDSPEVSGNITFKAVAP